MTASLDDFTLSLAQFSLFFHICDDAFEGLDDCFVNFCLYVLGVNHVIYHGHHRDFLLLVQSKSGLSPLFIDLVFDNCSEALFEAVEFDLELCVVAILAFGCPPLSFLQVHLAIFVLDNPRTDVILVGNDLEFVNC